MAKPETCLSYERLVERWNDRRDRRSDDEMSNYHVTDAWTTVRGNRPSSTLLRGGASFRCPGSLPPSCRALLLVNPMRMPSIVRGFSTYSCPNVGRNTASGLVKRATCSTLVAGGEGLPACSSETFLPRTSTVQIRQTSRSGSAGTQAFRSNNPTRRDASSALPSAQFDLAFAYSVFSHLSPKSHLAWRTELARVMKPNGILFITTQAPWFLDHCRHFREHPDEIALRGTNC